MRLWIQSCIKKEDRRNKEMTIKFTRHLVASFAASLIAVNAVDLESVAKLETKTKINLT